MFLATLACRSVLSISTSLCLAWCFSFSCFEASLLFDNKTLVPLTL